MNRIHAESTRVIVSWLLAGVVAALVLVWALPRAFPFAAPGWQVTRGEATTIALERLRDLGSRRLILVHEQANNRELRAHVEAGYAAVTTTWLHGELRIVLLSGDAMLASFPIDAPRGSRDGIKRHTQGLMYAIAAACGLGLSAAEIRAALAQAPPMLADYA